VNRHHLPTFFLNSILLVELVDELVDGAGGAVWPAIRSDLGLSYVDIGLLLTLPRVVGSLLEPAFALLSDTGRRRALVLGGGVVFTAALALVGVSGGFWPLLVALALFNPASGAFVSLSQASLADADPARLEPNLARWALAGSLGNVLGPVLVGAVAAAGLGWRPVYFLLAAMAALALTGAWCAPAAVARRHEPATGFLDSLRGAWEALRRGAVLRWLVLLEFADLMLDVFRGFVALYFVDVVGSSEIGAIQAVAVLTGVGLLGDALLLPLLERVAGLHYLHFSARLVLVIFPAFLLGPLSLKFVGLGLVGFLTAGWYSILKAHLYASLPGRSGTVVALENVTGLVGSLIPLALGLVAQRYGLGAAMWLLLAGPLALIIGLAGVRKLGEPSRGLGEVGTGS
jgi:FSR family fosmidomycin resistance protein-like MFS transporter